MKSDVRERLKELRVQWVDPVVADGGSRRERCTVPCDSQDLTLVEVQRRALVHLPEVDRVDAVRGSRDNLIERKKRKKISISHLPPPNSR